MKYRLILFILLLAAALLAAVAAAVRAAEPEILPIRIDAGFTSFERSGIVRAINEWNAALNGFVRLDVVDGPSTPSTWVIAPIGGTASDELAVTLPLASGGGLVLVHTAKLWRRDVRNVLLHEIGHVLGLRHDRRSRLMSGHYRPDDQYCVDRPALAALAARRNLPLAALHWCDGG